MQGSRSFPMGLFCLAKNNYPEREERGKNMHSRIFQLSKKPVTNFLTGYDMEDHPSFLGPIADYVTDVSEERRRDAIKWLGEAPGIEIDGDQLKIVSKKEYFAGYFQEFQKAIRNAAAGTLEDFIRPEMMYSLYDIERAVRDKFGFYAVLSDSYFNDVIPLTDFVRSSSEGEVWHLGSVLDYHY